MNFRISGEDEGSAKVPPSLVVNDKKLKWMNTYEYNASGSVIDRY